MTVASDTLRQRYESALAAVVAQLEQDRYVIAAILFGSLHYDAIWEKSDIDLLIVSEDGKVAKNVADSKSITLMQDGINIHAMMTPRAKFKKMIEGAIQSSFMHSMIAKSRLLFTKDETLRDLYEDPERLGSHDRQIQLFRAATWTLPSLYKAQKWLYVKKDPNYSFLWIMKLIEPLAQVECYLKSQITGREVVQQAIELNPKFFNAVYSDLMNTKKTNKSVAVALDQIDSYLSKKIRILFEPLLEYLKESASPRSASEIETHFKNQLDLSGATMACEWLSDKDIIQKISSPVQLTEKSQISLEEAAFYYDGA